MTGLPRRAHGTSPHTAHPAPRRGCAPRVAPPAAGTAPHAPSAPAPSRHASSGTAPSAQAPSARGTAPRRYRRPGALAAAACLAVLAGVPAAAGTAHAAGYRYWSFWEGGDGKSATWAYATQGPATLRPADGAVNGYRFAVSTDGADADRPRQAPDFAAICAGTPAAPGTKRVALVVDFGVPADAPAGEAPPGPRTACARVAPDATAAEALAAVAAPLRYNSQALLCGISGYPRQGCGEQVDTAARPSSPPDPASSAPGATAGAGTTAGPGATAAPDGATASGGRGPSLGLYAGAAAVVALGAAALVRARRHGRR